MINSKIICFKSNVLLFHQKMQLSVRWLYNNEILLSRSRYRNGIWKRNNVLIQMYVIDISPGGQPRRPDVLQDLPPFTQFALPLYDAIVNLTTIKAIVIKSKNYLNYIHYQKLFSTFRWEFPLLVRQLFRFIASHICINMFQIYTIIE